MTVAANRDRSRFGLSDRFLQSALSRFLPGEWGRGLLLEYVFLEVTTVLLVRRDREIFEIFRTQHRTRLSFTDAAIVRKSN